MAAVRGISFGGGTVLTTGEAVSDGHPDKVADQISDAIVDLFLKKDPEARVACEVMATTQLVILAGEVRCRGAYENGGWAPGVLEEIETTVRGVIKDIGYEQEGFHWETLSLQNNLHGQSAHIAQGVDASGNKDEGAGDQGTMFGYATDETPTFMPAAHFYANRILQRLSTDRRSGAAAFLMPDAKSQVTIRQERGKPPFVESVVVSTQHKPGFDEGQGEAQLQAYVRQVIAETIPAGSITEETRFHINPTGSFEIGGPDGDAGLTGRKIIIDTYGGVISHGGGAFSGKDPTKVDRSASYMARYIAKNVVAAGLAQRCTVQLTYAIGVAQPLALRVDTHGTGIVAEEEIAEALTGLISLTPRGIRERLNLSRPIYQKTASYGHFGRDDADGGAFPWERTDLVPALKEVRFTPSSRPPPLDPALGATVSAYAEFEPVVAEAGSLGLLRILELIGRIFQHSGIRSELRPTSAFSFVIRIHVEKDTDEVSRILEAMLAFLGGDPARLLAERPASEMLQEMQRMSHMMEGLLRLSVENTAAIRQDVAALDHRLETATNSLHEAFLSAVQNLAQPIEHLRERLASSIDAQSAVQLEALVALAKTVQDADQVTQYQIDDCATLLRQIESRNTGFVKRTFENLSVGAISGVIGNFIFTAIQTGKFFQ